MSIPAILIVLGCLGAIVLLRLKPKNGPAETGDSEPPKQRILNEILRIGAPIKASRIGDALGIPDVVVYRLADELVNEGAIGKTVTQDIIRGHRIRIIHYHPVIGVSVHEKS